MYFSKDGNLSDSISARMSNRKNLSPVPLVVMPGLPDDDRNHLSSLGLHPGDHVSVLLHRERRGLVAEAFTDHFDRDVRFQGDRGVGMSEVVQTDSR